jgi:hypothetical protein
MDRMTFQPQEIGGVLYEERLRCADHLDRQYLVCADGELSTLYWAFHSPAG